MFSHGQPAGRLVAEAMGADGVANGRSKAGKAARGGAGQGKAKRHVLQDFIELHDVWVGRQPLQRLNFAQVVDLLNAVEVVLHAFDRDILPVLDRLRLENLRECALALLRDQAILVHTRGEHAYGPPSSGRGWAGAGRCLG